jgi:DUF1680 family protein
MKKIAVSLLAILWVVTMSCQKEAAKSHDYPISPVAFTDVKLQDQFWLPRIVKNTEVTIPIAFKHSENTDRINNFAVAGGLVEGEHVGKRYNDSDVFKIMEGAAYSLSETFDQELDLYLDSLIMLIGMAQEDDGYIYTARTINPDSVPDYSGKERWSFLEQSHELYNVGHMYEAAVAHYLATGKTSFLDIAIKNANLIDELFGWGKIENGPGHQEIEIGLVKLYRVTGEEKYLNLAKFFLDVRHVQGMEYNQTHKKVTEQTEPVGHAVRALYMYSGMADVAALTGDTAYITTMHALWDNVVNKKTYVTGGLGQTGGNEGFGPDYDLPNETAYCETCASIANVFWNQRMFLLTGESKYIDVMERTMYNALLSGVSLSGDRFFYPNVLESDGTHERSEWFGCACCPSNICRFLPSVPGYIYAQKENRIYINLFISSNTMFNSANGNCMIEQESNYPWDGNIAITVHPEQSMEQEIWIRIPGWAQNDPTPGDLYNFQTPSVKEYILELNKQPVDFKVEKGYAVIIRKWKEGDIINLSLPTPERKVLANEKVKQDSTKFAIQRGPLMYCLEGVDQESGKVLQTTAKANTSLYSTDLDGINHIHFEAIENNKKIKATAIPYYIWANRGASEMKVWIPNQE